MKDGIVTGTAIHHDRVASLQNESSSKRKNSLLLLALVLVSRVVLAVVMWKINGPGVFFTPDSHGYIELAQTMLHGSYSTQGQPEIFRAPGYPFLLLPGVALHHIVLVGLLENFVLALASAWLLWKIVTDLFPATTAAFWAVLFYCFEPMSLLQSEKLLTETAFTTLLLLSLWLLLRFLRQTMYLKLAASALALAGATYLRSISIYLWLFLLPILLLLPRSLPWSRRLLSAFLFPLLFGLILCPWILRNARVADYAGFSSTGDIDLYFYAAAAVEARLQHKPFEEVHLEWGWSNQEPYFQHYPEQRGWSPGKIARSCGAEARKLIFRHLPTYAVLHAQGCARTMLNPGVTELLMDLGLYPQSGASMGEKLDQGLLKATRWLFQEYPLAAILLPIMALQLVGYYGLALAGFRHLPIDARWVFLAIAAYFILISAIPGAVSRWRTPIMPIVCICAGTAFAGRKFTPFSCLSRRLAGAG